MTESVANTTQMSVKVWRRHTDPPGLWVAVVTGSVALHLLALGLIYSSNMFGFLSQQKKQTAVPIQLVDISPPAKLKPRPKAKAKSVLSNKQSVTKKSAAKNVAKQVTRNNSTAKPGSTSQPKSSIQQPSVAIAPPQPPLMTQQQKAALLAEQQAVLLAQQRQRELLQQQQAALAQQRQQELLQQQQAALAQQRQQELLQQQQAALAQQRQNELAQQSSNDLSQQASGEQTQQLEDPESGGGSLVATALAPPQEVEGKIHQNPPMIKVSETPFTSLTYSRDIEEKLNGQPLQVIAILTIDAQGKIDLNTIELDGVPPEARSDYLDVMKEALKDWEFQPAYDNDPNQGVASKIKIPISINRR